MLFAAVIPPLSGRNDWHIKALLHQARKLLSPYQQLGCYFEISKISVPHDSQHIDTKRDHLHGNIYLILWIYEGELSSYNAISRV